MNKPLEKKISSSIILLDQQFNKIDENQNEFVMTEEVKLKKILAAIKFDESKLIKNIKYTPPVIKAVLIGLIISSLLFCSFWVNTKQEIWLHGSAYSTLLMVVLVMCFNNLHPKFLLREISHEDYEKIALVAKYNPAVHQYAKEKLNKNQKIINEDYYYMKIQFQYLRALRFLGNSALEDKRKAISEILK